MNTRHSALRIEPSPSNGTAAGGSFTAPIEVSSLREARAGVSSLAPQAGEQLLHPCHVTALPVHVAAARTAFEVVEAAPGPRWQDVDDRGLVHHFELPVAARAT